ncbi:MAG TPA: DUF1269 domain-containing protein [Nocardioides sp.]|uniref:DUF1269 domain-containing protein n=1 Tax=Nocardioides sp. TaxID=35761 RepID=UPI002D7F4D91|nr:DUF1269 domain-containing protein [Nocardioides sp.]HET6653322.1 DUF1269 domain-containing protein [Nocardioides sp.]
MTAFTVWKFDDPGGAEHAADLLKRAADDGLVEILDHAVVTWPVGEKKPKVKHGRDDEIRGAGWGGFWGLLFGALWAVPLLGAAAGAAIGTFSRVTQHVGVSEEQLERIRDEITEGTSALFAVTEEGNLDRLGERFRGVHFRLIDTNLTPAERETLLETFAQD